MKRKSWIGFGKQCLSTNGRNGARAARHDANVAAMSATTTAIFQTSTKSSRAGAAHNNYIDGILIEWHHLTHYAVALFSTHILIATRHVTNGSVFRVMRREDSNHYDQANVSGAGVYSPGRRR